MVRKIIFGSLLGCLTLLIWLTAVNTLFRVSMRVNMNRLPNEREVYTVLAEEVAAPGVYVVNPELIPGDGFPPNMPVYTVSYSGFGHEAAGRQMLFELGAILLAMIIASSLLANASENVLARYGHRVMFFSALSLVIALTGKLTLYNIGGYPLGSAFLATVNTFIAWSIAGLVVARFVTGKFSRGEDTSFEPAT